MTSDRSDTRPAAQPGDVEPDPEAFARRILLDQLTGRARSRSELADKLRSKAVPDEIATRLLDRFTEVGLIDDEAFAQQWVEGRVAAKGLGRRALVQELQRKGVAPETIDEALESVDDESQAETARLLVRRKLRSMSGLDDTKATRRLVGMLARKGYPPGMSFEVVRSEMADAGRELADR